MNIVITKEEHSRLLQMEVGRVVMGSTLYGTATDNSDIDYLCFYKKPYFWGTEYYPNIHQFQYTEDNVDYIWTNSEQFWRNQRSGDSTINSDIVMFNKTPAGNWTDGIMPMTGLALQYCRTYKVIKAFLGFAKRDLKDGSDHKITHAERSMHCAHHLLDNMLPNLTVIQEIYGVNRFDTNLKAKIPEMLEYNKKLRTKLNGMYDSGELKMYYVPKTNDLLLNKLLDSNNTKEFRYE